MAKPLTAIIPTHNNLTWKQGCLANVLDMIERASSVVEETIVVDNASTDETRQCYGSSPRENVRVIVCDVQNNRAAARNAAARRAKTDFLVFLDDDTLVDPARMIALAGNVNQQTFYTCATRRYFPLGAPRSAIGTATKTGQLQALTNWCTRVTGGDSLLSPSQKTQMFSSVSNFSIIPRKLFEAVGGFNESFEGWGMEDTELLARLIHTAPLSNLFGSMNVVHIDHFVLPYNTAAHTRNIELYLSLLATHAIDFDYDALADRVIAGERVIELDTSARCAQRAGGKAPYANQDKYTPLVDEVAQTLGLSGLLGVLLIGSATYSDTPRDIDLVLVARSAPNQVFPLTSKLLCLPVEARVINLRTLRQLIRGWHTLRPEDLILELGNWQHGTTITDPQGVLGRTQEALVQPSAERTAYLLAYFVGRAKRLTEKAAVKIANGDWTAVEIKRIRSSIQCVLSGEYPRSVADLHPANIARGLDETWRDIVTAIKNARLSTPKSVVASTFEGLDGIRIIKGLQPGWEGVTMVRPPAWRY